MQPLHEVNKGIIEASWKKNRLRGAVFRITLSGGNPKQNQQQTAQQKKTPTHPGFN